MNFESWTLAEWGTIATVVLSVVAIIIAIVSSRQTSQLAHKQIESITNLSQLQLEATLLLVEEELFKAKAEYKKVELQAKIEGEELSGKFCDIGSVMAIKKAHEQQYAPILQGYQTRMNKLQQIINELKSKKDIK